MALFVALFRGTAHIYATVIAILSKAVHVCLMAKISYAYSVNDASAALPDRAATGEANVRNQAQPVAAAPNLASMVSACD